MTLCTYKIIELRVCETLEAIDNGSVNVSGVAVGSTANYTCNEGYQLKGPPIRTCQSDGTWSGMEPTCIGKRTC